MELKLGWFSWELYGSLGLATSLLYLFKYYYPALKKTKAIIIEQEIDPKELTMFHPVRVGFMSMVYGIVYAILFPVLLLGIIFGTEILKESTENLLLKEACAGA